jgi:hypothetical protein
MCAASSNGLTSRRSLDVAQTATQGTRGSGCSNRWSEDFGRTLVKRALNRLNPRIAVAGASGPAAGSFVQNSRMPAFEDWMNRLSDMDSGWWPFLSQRPPKDVLIDDARLLSMSVRFGPTYGAVITAALS